MSILVTVRSRQAFGGVNRKQFQGMGKRWEIVERKTCACLKEAIDFVFSVLTEHPDFSATLMQKRE